MARVVNESICMVESSTLEEGQMFIKVNLLPTQRFLTPPFLKIEIKGGGKVDSEGESLLETK